MSFFLLLDIIPTYVYSLHIGDAGVINLINDVFGKHVNLKDEAVRESVKPKLEEIQKRILATPINEEVKENLDLWLASLPDDVSCAVRSSGSAEDLASQSFAGQYDSFMYRSTADEICDAVKLCWASMFKPFVLDYAARTSDETVHLKPPKMGVLVMKMVTAKVCMYVCMSLGLFLHCGLFCLRFDFPCFATLTCWITFVSTG